MRAYAFCTEHVREAVSKALPKAVLSTSPPGISKVELARLQAEPVLWYIRLHGLAGGKTLYGEGSNTGWMIPALTLRQVQAMSLHQKTVVVLASCWQDQSPFPMAFLDAGAGAVVYGAGINYANPKHVTGTDTLARWLLLGLNRGWTLSKALRIARVRIALGAWRRANRDTLGFAVIRREEE